MKFWRITVWGLLFLLAVGLWASFVGFSAHQKGSFYNKGNNAVWVGHTWVGDEHSEEEVKALVDTFKTNEIKTVFVHSGPFGENGVVDVNRYLYAEDFLRKARRFDKEIQYQAWLGQLRSVVDLDDEGVRRNMVKQAVIFANLIGFDGIHFNIEPVWDEDVAFVDLLKESREALFEEKKISVSLPEIVPGSLVWFLEGLYSFKKVSTEILYEAVAEHVDQMVIMTYDTGLNSERLYKWRTREQFIWISRLLEGVEIFMGIPAYEASPEQPHFNNSVENMKNGLLGVLDGLNNSRSDEKDFAGVSIYSFWEIDEDEWKTYRNIWLNKK